MKAGQFAAKIGAHGLVGGASSVLQGGKFGHGFAAAGVTQALAPAIGHITVGPKDGQFLRITVAAIVGGSISEATGGKFAMGAVTGAFSRAFNDELHFNGKKLKHYDDDGNLLSEFEALSGKVGTKDLIMNKDVISINVDFTGPENQDLVNKGPIPEGEYMVRQDEYQSIKNIGFVDRIKGSLGGGPWPGNEVSWGEHRIWLQPMEGTNTYGRSGFSIHGGAKFGSAGCIDLCNNMNDFIKSFHSSGKDMKLIVNYKK